MTIQSEEDRKKLRGAIQEISNSMTRTEAERDLIKEIVKEMSDLFQIPKKTIKKIATTYHRQTLTQEVADHEDFVDLYETVTK